ncbi:MAG: chorismate synthase [Hyphomonadaceae bacterium]|nr:chorismate synthase [Clostridia bacterium]
MSTTFGRNVRYTLFGESHGGGIGIILDGLPSGVKLDMAQIYAEMKRRAPGQDAFSTARKEEDAPELLSGFFEGYTTGTPLCALIKNTDQRSRDYAKLNELPRPSHGDYCGSVKYGGFQDYRGGGHFSGRLTAPLVFAGAVAKQILAQKGIAIHAVIRQIGTIKGEGFSAQNVQPDTLDFPVFDPVVKEKMQVEILKAKHVGDSVGGVVETVIYRLPVGLGDPFFDSFESRLSHLMFSVPAVKGIEFGEGFALANMLGSEANDSFVSDGKNITTTSNHNGGILGGITSGMPVIFRTAFKPTPSISKEQQTVNLRTMENEKLVITGRHDPCVVPRAVVVTESVAAMVVLDFLVCGGKVIE